MRRPGSLVEITTLANTPKEFGYAVAEFLDQFYIDPGAEKLTLEPPILRERLKDNGEADSYLAAVAVHLSRRIGESPPRWTYDRKRFLSRPWFASAGSSLRATLLLESPAAFRERNLFVSANALDRA